MLKQTSLANTKEIDLEYNLIIEKLLDANYRYKHLVTHNRFYEQYKRFYDQIRDIKTRKSVFIIKARIVYMTLEMSYYVRFTENPKSEFRKMLGIGENTFRVAYTRYLTKKCKIDPKEYKTKVLMKGIDILNKISVKNYKGLDYRDVKKKIVNKLHELYDFLESYTFNFSTDETSQKIMRDLRNHLNPNGFDIKKIFRAGYYSYFYPQDLGVFLLYLCVKILLRQKEIKFNNASNDLDYRDLCLENTSFSGIRFMIRLFRNMFEKEGFLLKNTKRLTREAYLRKLEEFKAINPKDVQRIKNLFAILNVNLQTFAEIIPYRVHGNRINKGTIFEKLKRGHNLTLLTYRRMRKNLINLHTRGEIPLKEFQLALKYLDNLLNLKEKDLYHNKIKYPFKYNKASLRDISDIVLRKKLTRYLRDIEAENYPTSIFNNFKISASSFKLKGNHKEHLTSETIEKQLIEPLLLKRKIICNKLGFIHNLRITTGTIINKHQKAQGKRPDHQPILDKLISEEKVVSVEFPLWVKNRDGENVVGHIDLLAVKDREIIIADFKQSKYKMRRCLLQVIVYAHLLKTRLNLDSTANIKLVLFTENESWSFTPDILSDILSFVDETNKRRAERLKTTSKYRYDLKEELLKIVNA
ncbi:MAG: hypothetical protein ACFFAO_02825 [Candidatus Hermodarchaeota archaeon]